MGLKTTEYKVEKFNLVLPTAYAYVKELTMKDNIGEARIVIQQDRETALTLEPIEEFYLTFELDRTENPSFSTVYEILKGRKWVGSNLVGKLRGWRDDIVTPLEETENENEN